MVIVTIYLDNVCKLQHRTLYQNCDSYHYYYYLLRKYLRGTFTVLSYPSMLEVNLPLHFQIKRKRKSQPQPKSKTVAKHRRKQSISNDLKILNSVAFALKRHSKQGRSFHEPESCVYIKWARKDTNLYDLCNLYINWRGRQRSNSLNIFILKMNKFTPRKCLPQGYQMVGH